VTVTPASLVAAYPEWVQVNTTLPAVVTTAIAQAENAVDEDVVGARYDEAVMLAAGAWLFSHPYSRDMRDPAENAVNPYKVQLHEIYTTKGSAWRTVWSNDFGGWT
jgi:hypothetical protein